MIGILSATVLTATYALPAFALETHEFNIPAQVAAEAIDDFSNQAHVQILVAGDKIKGKQLRALLGAYSTQDGLTLLLEDTGLRPQYVGDRSIALVSTQDLAPAAGKKSEPSSDATLEEIVVTAQKREQRLQDVPISVVALGGAELEKRGIRDLKELSYAVPGMYVQDGGVANRRISIRGIGNIFGGAPTVGVYLDEVPISTSVTGQIDVQAHDMERIEVLRGPQGTLYGQGSMGGTIRYVTADPDLSRVVGSTDADYAITKGGDPLSRIRGVISLPLVTDKLAVRVAALYEDAGGWVDQPAIGKRNIDGHQLFSARAKLLWMPTEALEVRAMAMFRRNDTGSGVGVDGDGNFEQALGIASTPAMRDPYDIYNLTVSYDFGSVRLLSTTSYMQLESLLQHQGGECCSIDDMFQFEQSYRGKSFHFTEEARLSSVGTQRLEWTVGAMYESRKGHGYAGYPTTIGFESTGPLESFDSEYWGDNGSARAVFGDASYALTNRLKLGAGLRRYEDRQPEGRFSATSPKVYLSYALNDQVSFYSSAAKGFRSGGFNGGTVPPYEPENLRSYEIGAKLNSSDHRIRAELAVVRSDYDDYQIVGVDPANIVWGTITTNAGDVRINGIDGMVAFKPVNGLQIGLSAS
ncbi:TonB-dependent receptor domain-containing protein, partial [Steroidobacter sp.]|uniref:TonB-dependent receptor domain-containing protein n=1 Tax=Steroidobacter sp. TaxID=1978227 RepID=UPI001A5CAAB2